MRQELVKLIEKFQRHKANPEKVQAWADALNGVTQSVGDLVTEDGCMCVLGVLFNKEYPDAFEEYTQFRFYNSESTITKSGLSLEATYLMNDWNSLLNKALETKSLTAEEIYSLNDSTEISFEEFIEAFEKYVAEAH